MRTYKVITTWACPCENCCGEILATNIQAFTSADLALEEFDRADLDNEQGGVESSCWPWQRGSWFSRAGEDWSFPNPCDETTAKEISLHLPSLSEKYERRIAQRLGVIKGENMQYSATLYRDFSKEEYAELGITPERWHGNESTVEGVLDCLKARVLEGIQVAFWDGTMYVEWENGQIERVTLFAGPVEPKVTKLLC